MVLAHLRLLARVSKRAVESFQGLALNNLVLCLAFLLVGSHSRHTAFWAALPFLTVLIAPMLVASASDVFEQFPASRSGLLPLVPWQRFAASVAAIVLNPLFWAVAFILLYWGGPAAALAFLLFASAVQICVTALRTLSVRLADMRSTPRLARVSNLFTLRLRELLGTLDIWAAAIIAGAGITYRIIAHAPDPAAPPVLAVIIALALSTTAQRTLALAGLGGRTRLRLLPIPGWRLLLFYDLPLLAVTAVLCAPFHLGAGLACTLAAIAVGRWPSIHRAVPQRRWRFTAGEIRFGAAQVFFGVLAGAGTAGISRWFFAAACSGYGLSVWLGARWWKRARS